MYMFHTLKSGNKDATPLDNGKARVILYNLSHVPPRSCGFKTH